MRDDWNTYFMKMAVLASERSTCLRRKVGAVAVKDNRVLCTGYNGSPSGLVHCDEIGCVREENKIPSGQRYELCMSIHAEQNLVVQAATSGVSLVGSTIFCTDFPCEICAKLLVGCKVERIFYRNNNSVISDLAAEILKYTKCSWLPNYRLTRKLRKS